MLLLQGKEDSLAKGKYCGRFSLKNKCFLCKKDKIQKSFDFSVNNYDILERKMWFSIRAVYYGNEMSQNILLECPLK